MRPRTLFALLAVVLLGHWLALSGSASAWQIASPEVGVRSLSTRSIAAAPATPAVPDPAATAAARTGPPAGPPAGPAAAVPKPIAPLSPTVPKLRNLEPNTAIAQGNAAQAAIETIVAAQPTPADRAPELEGQTTPSAETTPPSASAAAPALASSATATANPGEAAATAGQNAQLRFPPSGSFGYNATLVRGLQTLSATGVIDWASDGSTYQLELVAKIALLPVLRQTSAGSLSAAGLAPSRFTDKRFNRSEQATHFQPDKGLITFANNRPNKPLLAGAQDRVSVLMQLAAMVAGNPAQMQAQRSIALQVAGTDDADTWQFAVEGSQSIALPGGNTIALHLVRYPRKEFDARLEVWLAPTLGYLPARLKQTEHNGDIFELLLHSPAVP